MPDITKVPTALDVHRAELRQRHQDRLESLADHILERVHEESEYAMHAAIADLDAVWDRLTRLDTGRSTETVTAASSSSTTPSSSPSPSDGVR